MGAICRQLISCRRRGVFGVHGCTLGLAALGTAHCQVKQLCNLEVLGVSTAITRFLASLYAQSMRVVRFRVPPLRHILTFGPAVSDGRIPKTWQQRVQRLLTMHATSCASNCGWYMWDRVCTKLQLRLVIECAEVMVFIQKPELDRNTQPRTGGDRGVILCTLEEVAVENEQRDVEGGVSEMHESWTGTPVHPSTPLFPTSELHD
jgi:hypothetical protein